MTTTELLVAVNMFNVEFPTFLMAVIFSILAVILVIGGIVLAVTK